MTEDEARAIGAKIHKENKTLPMIDEFHTATWKEQEWMIEGWMASYHGENPRREKQEDTVEHHMDVWLLVHSIPHAESEHSPGIVVDADVAARTPCTMYAVGDSEIAFSRGIVGALDEAQKEAYCPTKEYKRSPGIEKRLRNWQEAVKAAQAKIKDVPKGERLEPWLRAMSEELGKRGVEV